MDHKAHFSNLLRLLKIEREEDRKQYQQKIQNKSVEERKSEGVCWYPVSIKKSYLGIGEKWVLEVERASGITQRHLFQTGSSANLFLNDEKFSVSGIISRVVENSIMIMLNHDEPPEWLNDGKPGLDLLFDESTYDEMERTVSQLAEVSQGRLFELIEIIVNGKKPEFGHQSSEHFFSSLNESQNIAINKLSAAHDVALIHGPPGTGKTTTLVQGIIEALKKEKQVLVCAPSNAAVDLIVEKLHKQSIDVIRLGHPARVTEEVIAHTLDAQIVKHPDAKLLKELKRRSEEMRRLSKQYKRKYGRNEAIQRKQLSSEAKKLKGEARQLESYIIRDSIDSASVIACTLIGANSQYMYKRFFKTVFIDESSQALEAASWIPIMRAERVILVGDHLQLSPTVKSIEALNQGFGNTIFERCIQVFHADTMLKTQYRMHPEIMRFSNNYFYNGDLETGESVMQRAQLFDEPILFVDTAGCGYEERINPDTLSTYNEEEASFALSHLYKILESLNENIDLSIGIIAPYKAQIEKLRSQFNNFNWSPDKIKNLVINTVDAFQGQERDIIYISLTRSNDRGEIGFLADERRMNVAMTRAKHKLVIIGDSSTLSTNPFFDKLIQFYQEQNYYHSAFEYIY